MSELSLPSGWATASISDVIREVRATDPAAEPNAEITYFDIGSIDNEAGKISDPKMILGVNAPSRARQIVEVGDVLFSTVRPNLRAVAVVPDVVNGIASTGFCVLRAAKSIHPKYLYFFVRSEGFLDALLPLQRGVSYPAVRSADVVSQSIPLAPAEEQVRIVEKLEELLSDLDAGVAELKAAQKKLAQYRQSLLNAAVEGRLTGVFGGYQKEALGQLVISIGQGWSPRCDGEAVSKDAEWAVMKTTAIQPMRFDGRHNKKLPMGLKPRANLELMQGDLLVTRAGPRTRVGITCLVRQVKKRLILCDKAYRVRCNESLINPEFLELVLNAPSFVNAIDAIKTGINDSGLNLTQDRFFSLMIPVPPLDEQVKIIKTVESDVSSIEQQALAIEQSLKQAAAQRKNILQAAFSGRLVPQDSADEPASVLLERIRTERAARTSPITPCRRATKTK